ncbi:MAG: Rrf2 family transcriptional regulator [Bdellovibrionales bacterium]|nr:Rrf2 family transcriptional regulator [Bdellovibrionales bacterium]
MLSAPSKYAIRALIFLSETDPSEFYSVESIAEHVDVPSSYLSKIIAELSEAGFVKTKKGAKGGVQLSATAFSFRDVCEALGDPVLNDYCFLSSNKCSKRNPCEFHERWHKERLRINNFLEGLKIQR